MERKTGLEPATPTLARSCSTNWAIFAYYNRLATLYSRHKSMPDKILMFSFSLNEKTGILTRDFCKVAFLRFKIRKDWTINRLRILIVSEMRFELTQPNGHYPLKVACLPIPPPGLQVGLYAEWSEKRDSNPRPRPWQGRALPTELFSQFALSEKRDSNPRPRPWQGRALPTELFSHTTTGLLLFIQDIKVCQTKF